MKLNNCFVFDFEATTSEPSNVYLGGFCRMDKLDFKNVSIFNNISDIISFIFQSKHNNKTFYAHNLKYDLSFIMAYLFQNHRNEFLIFDSIIMPMTKTIFKLSIVFEDIKITFCDSYPLFSAPLKKVMKAYTNLEKGETPLFKTLADVVIDQVTLDYLRKDVIGLGLALKERLNFGLGALTTASGAFKEYKKIIENEFGKNNFKVFFPLLDFDSQKEIRTAYRGGFTFLNPEYKEKKLFHVKQIDVNSMYPAQMVKKLLPYGQPLKVDDGEVITDDLFKLGIQKFIIKECFIKDGFIPFLSNTNSFLATNVYIENLTDDEDLEKRTFSLTLDEFELFKKSYNYKGLELKGGWLFKGRSDLFNNYVSKFWEMKSSENETIKALGKLFLNALYGKFSEGYEKEELEINYNDKIIFDIIGENIRECGYLPVGVFITSYSRVFLIETILKIIVDNFVYCDTDSVHFLNDVDLNKIGVEIDKEAIGKWSFKDEFIEAFYIRAKRYAGVNSKGELDIACAGIKKVDLKEQVKFLDEFRQGKKINTFEFKQGVNGMFTRPKIIEI